MTVTIEHYKVLPGTPGLRLAVRCWHELLDAGLIGESGIAVCWDHRSVVAFEDGAPVGVLTWADQEWANQLYVCLAYVLPGHRRKGVHSAMFNSLTEKARELNRPVIASSTSIRNAVSVKSMLAQGRALHGYHVTFEVPPA